jgi:hypothetical protein
VPRRLGSLISVTLVSLLLLLGAPGCGLRHHTIKGRTGSLSVTPPSGRAGMSFALMASGFLPGEAMTFEIDGPNKIHFVGPSHTADPQGTVSSTYVPQSGDPAGVYTVLAVGNRGTRAQGSVTVTG